MVTGLIFFLSISLAVLSNFWDSWGWIPGALSIMCLTTNVNRPLSCSRPRSHNICTGIQGIRRSREICISILRIVIKVLFLKKVENTYVGTIWSQNKTLSQLVHSAKSCKTYSFTVPPETQEKSVYYLFHLASDLWSYVGPIYTWGKIDYI